MEKTSLELFGHGCSDCIWESIDGQGWYLKVECPACASAREARTLAQAPTYAEKRAKEYPAIGDQLDALVKCIKRLKAAGIDIGVDAEAWVAACEAVKAKYPKPE